MKNKVIKSLAVISFIVSVPLTPIELIFGHSSNIFSRIKQNFQIIMFAANIGHSQNR